MTGSRDEGGWRRRAAAGGLAVEGRMVGLLRAARRRRRRAVQLGVHPYLGFGTDRLLLLKGRVLRGDPIVATATDTLWRNLRNMWLRLESDEIRDAVVRGRHARLACDATSDDEGYFDLHFDLGSSAIGDAAVGDAVAVESPPKRSRTGWVPIELELLVPPARGEQPPPRATGQVLVPRGARFGVISDLDDTVIRSEITDTLKMLRVALTSNPHTRLPFDGVADFYHALERGPAGGDGNPIFYVSSSPWNLHDLLVQFMTAHNVPIGPLLLRDWSPRTVLSGGGKHKVAALNKILETYPGMEFVLIGDSGEHDPEIYAQVVREHPGRARAVYIRDVTAAGRRGEVLKVAEELRDLGADLLLATDTSEVVAHARRLGLIGG